MFFKLGVLKNFVNFTRQILCQSPFLIKLQGSKCQQLSLKETKVGESKKPFSTEHLWRLLLKSKKFLIFSDFVIISFLFETWGFTNNPDFIRFKWRLKRKHSPAKCVIQATEIRRVEIHLICKHNLHLFLVFLLLSLNGKTQSYCLQHFKLVLKVLGPAFLWAQLSLANVSKSAISSLVTFTEEIPNGKLLVQCVLLVI